MPKKKANELPPELLEVRIERWDAEIAGIQDVLEEKIPNGKRIKLVKHLRLLKMKRAEARKIIKASPQARLALLRNQLKLILSKAVTN